MCTVIELVWFYAKPAPIGAEFQVLVPSIVRSVLLLVTNLAATVAIGLKVWCVSSQANPFDTGLTLLQGVSP